MNSSWFARTTTGSRQSQPCRWPSDLRRPAGSKADGCTRGRSPRGGANGRHLPVTPRVVGQPGVVREPAPESYRPQSYGPHLNPIERLWKKLRRRATYNRLFDTLAGLKAPVRASLSYFRVVRHKVKNPHR